MKRLILATLLASVALPAMAADMPVKAAPRFVEPIAIGWTGFYIFGSAGYSWGNIDPDALIPGGVVTKDPITLASIGLSNPKPKGGVFGFGGGYLWQTGRWVGGLEVDYSFSDEKDSQSLCLVRGGCSKYNITLGLDSKIDALGSARLRAGYLLMDNLLAYGTAGVGWGRANVSANLTLGDETLTILNSKTNLFGWVAGGGVEWKVFEHVRLRGEYLHYDFGTTTYAFQTPLLIGVNINAKTTDDVARAALIWSFN